MRVFQLSKVSNRKNVVNMSDGFPFALFADPAGSRHGSFFGSPPSDSVSSWCPALPSRMGHSNHKLRLPFSHTGSRAERLVRVKVGGSTAERLEALSTCLGDAIASAWIGLADLRCHAARKRTELLVSLASACGWLTTHRACQRLGRSPSVEQITLRRAEGLGWPSVVRTELIAALCAVARFIGSHINIIAQIEEKYCEIAAKRLAQEVLAL